MTDDEFRKSLDAADRVTHQVEREWHFPIMQKFGYTPITPSQVGFVRRYHYVHMHSESKMVACTGVRSDYWVDPDAATYTQGLWSELEAYLTKKHPPKQGGST